MRAAINPPTAPSPTTATFIACLATCEFESSTAISATKGKHGCRFSAK
jgi:hypothetical protein